MEDFSRDSLENYFKNKYPVNWCVWLRDAFCSFYNGKVDELNKSNNEHAENR